MSQGIDVSHHNKNINWSKVKSDGITFAVAKATEGATYVDPTFQQNWQGMKQNNIKAAAYHYLRGNSSLPEDQVANIWNTLTKVNFDGRNDILAIDVEEIGNTDATSEEMADSLHEVLNGLKGKISNLYIYCSSSYWENKVSWRKHDFSQYKLWIAHYTTASAPTIPTTWKNKGYTWWQYTETGRVGGIEGNVDLNRTQ